jgi:hypothetical protein
MTANEFEGRPYAADGSHFPAAEQVGVGGTHVQDWRTQELREHAEREAEFLRKQAEQNSGEAEDQ